jgi:S1-C subfamily serine protease
MALWGISTSATAQPMPVQMFSEVSRSVVAVGAAFSVNVEVYASPRTAQERDRVEQAFAAARFEESAGLEMMRTSAMQVEEPQLVAGPIVLRRTFVFRAPEAGTYTMLPLRWQFDEETYATAIYPVTAYRVDPVFFKASAGILPIVAEYRDARRRDFVRVGSAFLVAPDAVVTSLHVVMDARRVRLTLPNGKRISTKKAWVLDPTRDVAVLYVNPKDIAEARLTPLALAPEETVRPVTSEPVVFTNGWTGGVQHSTAGQHYPDMTLEPGEGLWISANPVRPGDSGGPLLDPYGRVLGVVSSGAVSSGQPNVLREEVCIALDPRPALGQMQAVEKPRSLKSLMRDPALVDHPHMQAIRLTTLLSTGRRLIPNLAAMLADLDTSRRQEPDNARLQFLSGVIYHMLGTRQSAAEAYQASLAAYDGHFLAAYMLAVYYMRHGNYEAAQHLFERTRQYQPYLHLATYGLAQTLIRQRRYAEAVPYLHAVVGHDPAYAPAFYDLAIAALAMDDEPRALQLKAKLGALSPVTARRLERVIREPVLRPRVVHPLPLATIRDF